MELYLLDNEYLRVKILEDYETLGWTEKWQGISEFNISTPATNQNISDFAVGNFLGISTSYKIMQVRTILRETNAEGKDVLTVGGVSFESILEDRVYIFNDAVYQTKYFNGKPADIARQMFDHICRIPESPLITQRIPLAPGSGPFFSGGDIPEPSSNIDWYQEPDSLYNALMDICTTHGLGFRFSRNPFSYPGSLNLYFDIYAGSDRSETVIFSLDNDSLTNIRQLKNSEGYFNIAYLYGEGESAYVQVLEGDGGGLFKPGPTGVRFRILTPSLAPEVTSFQNELNNIGARAIKDTYPKIIREGVASQNSPYEYNLNYVLGDKVSLDINGQRIKVRISEQTFISDLEGYKAYPTFS